MRFATVMYLNGPDCRRDSQSDPEGPRLKSLKTDEVISEAGSHHEVQ